MAVGTAVLTQNTNNAIRVFTWEWTAGTGAEAGTVSSSTTFPVYGQILALVTVPGTGGDAPDDNYDITVTDSLSGIDALWGAGANRDTADTEQIAPTSPSVCYGTLTLNVTNAGSANKGTAYVYVRG